MRESLESSRKAITEEKGGITSVKRQAQDSARGTSKQKRNKRALFVVGDDPPSTNNLIAALLCRDATSQVGFEDFLEEENILTEVSLKKKEYSRLHVLSKLSVIPTLDKFILRCGTKFVRVQFFAIFPAICKNKLPQIKFTANIFPEKFTPEQIFSKVNSLQKNTVVQ